MNADTTTYNAEHAEYAELFFISRSVRLQADVAGRPKPAATPS